MLQSVAAEFFLREASSILHFRHRFDIVYDPIKSSHAQKQNL